MKATALLEKQHRKVQSILRKLESGRSEPQELLTELSNDLAAHMAIEQEIFYPALREADEKIVLESYEEHALAEIALKRLLQTERNDVAFRARVKALKDLIEHHIEEEEDELFPTAEKTLGDDRLNELGKEMKARFDEVVEAGFEASVPKGFSKTSSDVAKRTALRSMRRAA